MTQREFQKADVGAKDKPVDDNIAEPRVFEAIPMNFLSLQDLEEPLHPFSFFREKQTKFVVCSDISISFGCNVRLEEDVAKGKNLIGDNDGALRYQYYTVVNYSAHRSRAPRESSAPTVFPKCDHFTQINGVDLTGEQKHESTL